MTVKSARFYDPRTFAIGIALLHLALNIVHGMAHARLATGLDAAQKAFVAVVILAAPLVAGYLLWKGQLRTGGWLLAISMAGAFVFGVYFHFILPGPDNVGQPDPMAPHSWRELFEYTAIDLAIVEALGVLLGLAVLIKSFAAQNKTTASNMGAKNSP